MNLSLFSHLVLFVIALTYVEVNLHRLQVQYYEDTHTKYAQKHGINSFY